MVVWGGGEVEVTLVAGPWPIPPLLYNSVELHLVCTQHSNRT